MIYAPEMYYRRKSWRRRKIASITYLPTSTITGYPRVSFGTWYLMMSDPHDYGACDLLFGSRKEWAQDNARLRWVRDYEPRWKTDE